MRATFCPMFSNTTVQKMEPTSRALISITKRLTSKSFRPVMSDNWVCTRPYTVYCPPKFLLPPSRSLFIESWHSRLCYHFTLRQRFRILYHIPLFHKPALIWNTRYKKFGTSWRSQWNFISIQCDITVDVNISIFYNKAKPFSFLNSASLFILLIDEMFDCIISFKEAKKVGRCTQGLSHISSIGKRQGAPW